MENEKPESVLDICQKIRDAGIPDLADHLEAAWKRETSQSWHHREMEELIIRHEKEVLELKRKMKKKDEEIERLKSEKIEVEANALEVGGIVEAARRREATTEKSSAVGNADPKFDLCRDIEKVLKIGRDFQKQDRWRGAHHDTAKLLCDTIEYLSDRLSDQVGNAAAMREALEELVNHHCRNCPENTQYGCGVNLGGLLGFKCSLLKQARAALPTELKGIAV